MRKININWEKESKWYKPVLYFFGASFLLGFIFSVILFVVLAGDNLPSFEELENPQYDFASVVYDAQGRSFGKYYIENREPIDFVELSPNVINALIATEDSRYFKHSGVDVVALIRVVFKTILLQDRGSGGGSTISQQLAKLLYKRASFSGKSGVSRAWSILKVKLKEWITAVKLEKSYTKEEIMAMYLNKFEFINGAHGIQSAAEIYFGKNQENLSISEAACLVGMLQNPARFNPKRFPERTQVRRNVVLANLKSLGKIDRDIFDSLKVIDIDMTNFKRSEQSDGPAPYFRAELTKWLRSTLKKEEHFKPDGTPYNIYTDGIKIYTTIDLDYQRHAEDAIFSHMKTIQERYWQVWRGMNPFRFEIEEDREEDLRRQSVNRRIYYSDRYRGIFETTFAGLNKIIADKYEGFELTEPALRNIFKDEAKASKTISNFSNENLREHYTKLRKLKVWEEIKKTWNDFQIKYKEIFDIKVKMNVFDYNDSKEKEVEMSPMDSIIYHLRHLQAGMLAVDPKTGYIKAWVGGVNHKYFKFDHIQNRRQVGSTIKPFVYATAIGLQGISPCQTYEDIQYTIAPGDANLNVDQEWSPANANGLFTGNKYNLYQGLLYSKNSITVRLIKEMGSVEVIRELLDNVGISKRAELPSGRLLIPRLPSIGLGSVDLSVMEMSGAYTAFANDGVYTKPVFVSRIEDKYGRLIYNASGHSKAAINPASNAVIVDMLKNNTGGRFGMGVKSENGGKTGTTNDYADAWFMGITPSLVVGTWVGGDEKWVRFFTLDAGQGFVMARPVFQDFIKRIEQDTSVNYNPEINFSPPPPAFYDLINCEKYKTEKPEDELTRNQQNSQIKDEFDEEEDEFEEEEFEEEDDDELEEEEGGGIF